jgi:hypothetical protein
MHNYDILSLSMGGTFGKTLAVFATPSLPVCTVRGCIIEQRMRECNGV